MHTTHDRVVLEHTGGGRGRGGGGTSVSDHARGMGTRSKVNLVFEQGRKLFCPSSGGWAKIQLKLSILPRISIHVRCQFNSIVFATQR